MNKFTKTLLASAVMCMAVTTVAEARVHSGTTNISLNDTTSGGGELLFNLINSTKLNSYTKDLGITVKEFAVNPNQTISLNLNDSSFQSFVAAMAVGDEVSWGVAGSYRAAGNDLQLANFGFYTTAVGGVPSVFDDSFSQIDNTTAKHDDIVTNINGAPGHSDPAIENGSAFATAGNAGYTGNYNNDFQGALPFAGQGSVGQTLAFVHEGLNVPEFLNGNDVVKLNDLLRNATFNIQGNTGILSITPATSVPLPAAVWMFGAGLMGMLKLNRRKVIAA